ncbi:hypothetical protein CLOBY_17920 [Clostridium saccharobutylicum]|uniref:hypothetical protein n=1 Tax=Clostridium saccharobutylicum TaxID=169679 RepID=UPI0009839970|nr:hypothetical protein [Clostridium saccharobutylicum]AQS09661.1 hypothetical protein CLOBY_17920 [Clostridium saccharobutylicum]MBC2436944.1 hypothetical protein [Clostridium saccharobutylicum]NSB89295.1 hypothetical protein [Clostridium saccharobutylicum]NYC27949.1 hypothetical protein [Clostridium saccharobutylicum]OOM17144.1 hypothetical protein CLSAB_20920 [Clostridium saccharobutylicum]
MEIKYKNIRKKYLADALSFLGFRYMKFDNENGKEYSFEDNKKLQYAFEELIRLKKELEIM